MNPQIEPRDVVTDFLRRMKEWEALASRLARAIQTGEMSVAAAQEQRTSVLSELFRRFVREPIDGGRLASHPFGKRPVYIHDPELDVVTNAEMNGDEAWVTTTRERGSVPLVLVYHLRLAEQGWKLSDDRVRVRPDGTRVPFQL